MELFHKSFNRKRNRTAGQLLLVVVLLGSLAAFVAGCSTEGSSIEVSGTYRASGSRKTVSVSSPNVITPVKEFTLREDGTVTAVSSMMSSGPFSLPTGRYEIEGTRIEISFGRTPLIGRIENGEITFDMPYEGVIVYKKVFFTPDVIVSLVIPLFTIWLIITIIQGFLCYGLVYRELLRGKESGSGVALYATLAYYGTLALIPGLVIHLWLKERKEAQ